MSTAQQIGRRHGTSLNAEVLRDARTAGLLQPQTAYYITRITINTAGLSAAWGLFFLLGNSWLQLVTAGFLAFMFTQCAMISHEVDGSIPVFRYPFRGLFNFIYPLQAD